MTIVRKIATRRNLIFMAAFSMMMMIAVPGFAQTPVPITIDTNSLLSQINTWTSSLDDIIFLGTAIAIAIALLGFIGKQILRAFQGAS